MVHISTGDSVQLITCGIALDPLAKGFEVKLKFQINPQALADIGGTCQAHATPYGTQFFCFCIHFHQKVPASEVHAPLMGACPTYGKSWICHCQGTGVVFETVQVEISPRDGF